MSRVDPYPPTHNSLLERLKIELDKIFYNYNLVYRPVMHYTKLLESAIVTEHSLKQLYKNQTEGYYVRYDHTVALINQMYGSNRKYVNERTFGPVFRKEPSGTHRWTQFYTYDVDCTYADYGVLPVIQFMNYLSTISSDFTLVTYDNSIQDACENFSDYESKFYSKYPLLNRYDVRIDHSLRRTTGIYDDLMFEVVHKNKKYRSIMGGGTYVANNVKLIGFGIGVNRLLRLCFEENLIQTMYPFQKLLLCYYTDTIPINLITNLQAQNVRYVLKSKGSISLRDSFKLINTNLRSSRKVVGMCVIVDKVHDDQMIYRYKHRNGEYEKYDLNEFIDLIKTNL